MTLASRQAHWIGCKCSHCSPANINPKHEQYWAQQRGTFPAKRCGCGQAYTLAAFRALHFVGVQRAALLAEDGGGTLDLELRDCVCDSTIAIAVDHRGNFIPV